MDLNNSNMNEDTIYIKSDRKKTFKKGHELNIESNNTRDGYLNKLYVEIIGNVTMADIASYLYKSWDDDWDKVYEMLYNVSLKEVVYFIENAMVDKTNNTIEIYKLLEKYDDHMTLSCVTVLIKNGERLDGNLVNNEDLYTPLTINNKLCFRDFNIEDFEKQDNFDNTIDILFEEFMKIIFTHLNYIVNNDDILL